MTRFIAADLHEEAMPMVLGIAGIALGRVLVDLLDRVASLPGRVIPEAFPEKFGHGPAVAFGQAFGLLLGRETNCGNARSTPGGHMNQYYSVGNALRIH